MASRKIVGNSGKDFPPVVHIKAAPGVMFKGTLKGTRAATTVNGPKNCYLFAIIDSTAPIQKKDGGQWVEVDVKAGDEVEIFAPPTMLDGQLKQVVTGETVEIICKGRGKASPGKQAPYIFDVSVVA